MSGFFQLQPHHTSEELQLFSQLQTTLTKHRRLLAKPSLNEWCKQFRQLLKEYPLSKVQEVLTWYCQNIKREYVPIVSSAKAFRIKFTSIDACKKRALGDTTEQDITISPWTLRVQKQMGLIWPHGDKEKLVEDKFIQITLDNFSKYKKGMTKLQKTLIHQGKTDPKSRRLEGTVRYLLALESSKEDFTEQWVREIHRIAWHWKKWNGLLLQWRFDIDSKIFAQRQERTVQTYCGHTYHWNKIKGMLQNAD